jgi:hypothetical protein
VVETDQVRCVVQRPVFIFEVMCSSRDLQDCVWMMSGNNLSESKNTIVVIFEHQKQFHRSASCDA